MKRPDGAGEWDLHPFKREYEMTEQEKREQEERYREACRYFYELFGRKPPMPEGYDFKDGEVIRV